ncbi:hypothetical protein D8674_012880 [Pyrus ussuriensis x Pyrus communis]|uniref:BED-type domain-containing protein n=1 Tax=Pyrus ussuriensis x Pyrus communis TaxID=2448454 RepID=A0A5N5GSY1_9ROSA|nr:hypothetical protein D8674_012880 [Pyrus ussuriensis x Pyrus communis]
MASSSRPSGASVPGGLDVAWKYARSIEGNKHGTICTFCESTFQSGGITRLKYHLAGFDPRMRIFCQGDLVQPGVTLFATNYITINSILNKKAGLRQLFTSEDWYNSQFNESEEGKIIESRVLDHRFWDAMEGVQSIYEPLYSILKSIPPAEWWNLHGDFALNLQIIAMHILSQTTSSSVCERNWSTFALIHMKKRNRLTYTRLEKIVFCYYNMKLKLRDEEAEMNKVAENDYIDLLDIIMTAHLDDEHGNPDAIIAQHIAQEGVDVDRVIFEDVRSVDTSLFERDMLGTRQGQRRPLRDDASTSRKESSSNSSDNDGGSNAGLGDENHGCREAGLGIGAIGKPGTNSNESYDGYGYVMSDYSGTSYGAQDDETDYGPTSWVNPNYPMYGRTVGSSRETYVHHVQTWLTNYSGYMTWYDYCMNQDGCSSLFEPYKSSSFM